MLILDWEKIKKKFQKSYFYLVARPLRGPLRRKNFFLSFGERKIPPKNVATKLEGGGGRP